MLILVVGTMSTLLAGHYWRKPATVTISNKSNAYNNHAAEFSACTPANLTGTVSATAINSSYMNLILQNTGDSACTIQGAPELQLVDADGNAVGTPAKQLTTTKTAARITLAAAGTVKAAVHFMAVGSKPGILCKQGASALLVTPPNATSSITIPITAATWCPGFSVSAFSKND